MNYKFLKVSVKRKEYGMEEIMIEKYTFGEFINTEAVIYSVPEGKRPIPYIKAESIITKNGEKKFEFSFALHKKDSIYGLGEQVRGINKKGWIYESNCTDDPVHSEDKHSLYGAHNFFIVDGKNRFGIFIDCPGKVIFDFAYTNPKEGKITLIENGCCLYLIQGSTLIDIVKEFRKNIGQSYIPPKWAFGYQQSRWGYLSKKDIKKVITEHRKREIPLDCVYLDIDYMERFKDFTIDSERFPDMKDFIKWAKEQGVRLIPIIDAGVKIEEDYSVYEEGKEKGYFCKDKEGNDFVAGVWPGLVHFPDMLNKEAGRWFGLQYKKLIDMGFEGFWNDMNEPALFYSKNGLYKVYQKAKELTWDKETNTFDLDKFLELQPLVGELSNNPIDYQSFYHNIDGTMIPHHNVHNLYGYFMTRRTMESLEELQPDKRFLLFSRSSYIGMHRYSGIWTGDNCSWWSHLLLNIKMMPSLNMCGFLYIGADIGGFGADVTQDLLLRWLAFGIFTPLFRNHCALGKREQEIYQFDAWEQMRELIRLRYRLIPYLYSEFMKAVLQDDLYFRPLAFVYEQDEIGKEIEDQLFIGESIMIAPVYEQNISGRIVYLPEQMKLIRFFTSTNWEEEIKEAGFHYVGMEEGEVVLFLRKGHMLLLGEGGSTVEETEKNTAITIISFETEETTYNWYQDDGITKDYSLQHCSLISPDSL